MHFRGRTIRNEPSFRPRPSHLNQFHVFMTEGLTVYVPRVVLDGLIAEAEGTAPNETIGYVFGRPHRDSHGLYTLVSVAPVARRAKRRRAFVETTLADETAATALLDHQHITAERVGWWHSHPGFGSEYSGTDRENQRLVCPREYQVGLLVCIQSDERAAVHAFHGPRGKSCGPAYWQGKMARFSGEIRKDVGPKEASGSARNSETAGTWNILPGLIGVVLAFGLIVGLCGLAASVTTSSQGGKPATSATEGDTDSLDVTGKLNDLEGRVRALERGGDGLGAPANAPSTNGSARTAERSGSEGN